MTGAGWHVASCPDGAAALARDILTELPDWFGLPAALDRYVAAAGALPTCVARAPDGRAAGFLTVERHTAVAAELRVMGVRPAWHRQGCGRALVAHAERELLARGVRWFTVKTLAASHPDPLYAATRGFYAATGFEPLEVLPELWGPDLPCLLMAKRLA